MDNLLEALKKTALSEEQVNEVQKAVKNMIAEAAKKIESEKEGEFTAKLQEAYDKAAGEIAANESKTEEGYRQAYAIIEDLKLRLEQQKEELETKAEQGYQQAWDMLQAEQAKNGEIEAKVQNEANENVKRMRDFMIDKLDQYLKLHKAEIYDEARREILNDPKMVEHRVAIERMAEVMSDYMGFEEVAGVGSRKLSEAVSQIEDLQSKMKILEKKNHNLSQQRETLVRDLTEARKEKEKLITEGAQTERKNRQNVSGNVSGRGQRTLPGSREEVLKEHQGVEVNNQEVDASEIVNEMLVLSGIKIED